MKKWSNDNIKDIMQMYNNKIGSTTIAKKFGVCPPTILSILRKHNVAVNPDNRKIKYKFSQDKFENINTSEKAYWLGFLLGDASIDGKSLSLHLEINKIDRKHLEKFLCFINGNQSITDTKKECCRIVICGKQFIKSIASYGLVKNKSKHIMTPPIKPKYMSDFYRGILDADGWICKHGSQHEYGFSSGSMLFIMEIQRWIQSKLGKQCGYIIERKRKNQRVCQLVIGGNKNFINISKLFYNNPAVCLDRKANKVQEFLAIILPQTSKL